VAGWTIASASRAVAPTAAGERLLERLRPVLEEYQSALESTNEFRGRPAGQLRLTAPPPADVFLDLAIPLFLAQYPEISLDLSFNEALTDIVAERFDAGIRIGERIERDMIAVRVTDELPLVVAGSPAYFAQRGNSGDRIFSLLFEPPSDAASAQGLGRFSTRRAPRRVQATQAMNRQEPAISNRSPWLDGRGGPGRAVPRVQH
jgi:DNA-binding transcriptional LysR family regulator